MKIDEACGAFRRASQHRINTSIKGKCWFVLAVAVTSLLLLFSHSIDYTAPVPDTVTSKKIPEAQSLKTPGEMTCDCVLIQSANFFWPRQKHPEGAKEGFQEEAVSYRLSCDHEGRAPLPHHGISALLRRGRDISVSSLYSVWAQQKDSHLQARTRAPWSWTCWSLQLQ